MQESRKCCGETRQTMEVHWRGCVWKGLLVVSIAGGMVFVVEYSSVELCQTSSCHGRFVI